jgi:tRNA 2-thiouridine synthesizing protein A
LQWILRRECFLAAWTAASAEERAGDALRPACLFAASGPALPALAPASESGGGIRHDARWDAGDMACGDLVLELRSRVRALAPGAVLKVTAHDPAAPVDLPAWCGLTGHTMLHPRHPDYWIQRKKES